MKLDNLITADLITQCRAGDSAAIDVLISAHKTRIYRLALSMLDDPAEADEATQDTFIAAVNRLDSYRGDSSFGTWLYAIALNTCRERLRKRRTRQRLAAVLHALRKFDRAEHPEQTVIRREADAALWSAIRMLDDHQREAVILRYYHDLRLEDIARITGVTERTVRNRLYAAHQRLQGLLKAKNDDHA